MAGYYHKEIHNAEIRRPVDRQALRKLSVGIGASILVICGFAFSIWQHVESVTYGYRTEQLRRERQRLDAEKRKQELERAYRSSPEVIERAARDLGLVRPDSSQVVVANKARHSRERYRDHRSRGSR